MQPHPWTPPAKRRPPPFAILVLILFAAACTPAPETASMTGTVVDADTLAPLVGTTVVARLAGTATAVASDTCDALGTFTLEPLDAGVYDVELAHFGYAPQARADVTTLAGATADLGTIALTELAPSRLYGSTTSAGEFAMPIIGARVEARIAGTTTVIAVGFTDEHASYDLDPVPAGTYDVELSATDYVPRLVEGVVAPPGGSANVGDLRLEPIAP